MQILVLVPYMVDVVDTVYTFIQGDNIIHGWTMNVIIRQ